MSWTQSLLAAILALPSPWRSPETPVEREARVEMVVRVAVDVTRPEGNWTGWSHQERAALLLTKLIAESGSLNRDVHAGIKRGDRGASICLGQIHWGSWLGYDRATWQALGGTDEAATRRCLSETWRQLSLYRTCGPAPSRQSVASIFSGYGSGKGCTVLKWSVPRARMWNRLATAARPAD